MSPGTNDMDELKNRIAEAKMPQEAFDKTMSEYNKLKMMSPMSAEATVVRGYIDWMIQIPWAKRSKVRHDMNELRRYLTKITSVLKK